MRIYFFMRDRPFTLNEKPLETTFLFLSRSLVSPFIRLLNKVSVLIINLDSKCDTRFIPLGIYWSQIRSKPPTSVG